MLWIKVAMKIVKFNSRLNTKKYMKHYVRLLRKAGVNISEYDGTGYIDPTCFIDSSNYQLISIGNHVTISRNVTLLTHDFSIGKGLLSIGLADNNGKYRFLKGISIGDNSFIGLNSIILPGTSIGDGCIIGSGAVVKGVVPDYSVYIGNPGKVVADTREWARSHVEKSDYQSL